MKINTIFFVSVVVVANVLLFSGCSTFHRNVFLSSGEECVVQSCSSGIYDIRGRSFYIEPADETHAHLFADHDSLDNCPKNVAEDVGWHKYGNVDFGKLSKEFEMSLLYSGAVKAKDKESADMHIVIDFGVLNESYVDTVFPQMYSAERPAMNSLGGESYVEYIPAPRPSMRRVPVYKGYINLQALGNSNGELLWTMNLTSTGTSRNLEALASYMAYCSRSRYGKGTSEIVIETVGESDYMYELYRNGFLAKENIVEWPVCKASDNDFLVAFVASFEKETIICIRKTGDAGGCYSFGPSIFLDVNGRTCEGSVTHCDYLMGEEIWNETGTRYFLFRFPTDVSPGSTITMYEKNNRGKRGKEWSGIQI